MAQLIADRRDVDFVLHEQMGAAELAKNEKFAEFDKKTIDLIVTEARNLAIKEILPTQKPGDEGCRFENGKVAVPECFHKVYKLYNEGEWLAMTDDPEWGGQGMPKLVSLAANEYFHGANAAFMLYQSLSHGAAKLVETYGTEAQKKACLKNMYSGKWSGTMLLTEPEAGSDVGALTTSAKKNPDGTYSITGSKIFISGGEQDMVENIIHPVLARIEGAPEGTRGISLFLVPKYRIQPDGSLGEFNDVVCTGIEEKMGLHGNATCSLTLGGKGQCIGTLLGEENKGMRAMFTMMNEARQFVGLEGFAVSTAAYMYALNYARERIQSRDLVNPDMGPVPIIHHADVRRQLMIMKSYVEGMRSLIYYTGRCWDLAATAKNEEERARQMGLIDVLTPIVKGYITDKALEVTSHAVQVYGGYGYIQEYPVEQLMRDCRIFMIYEGTNGIQAIDLLGRKLGMNKGKTFLDYLGEIRRHIGAAKEQPMTAGLADAVDRVFNRFSETAMHLGKTAMSDSIKQAYIFAHPFLESLGDLTMAWMLLWRAAIAAPKLEKLAGASDPEAIRAKAEKNKEIAFYDGQIKTARFFIHYVLPVTMGRLDAILKTDGAAVEMIEAAFGG
ncbi:MAG: acyl-CoA dehydrogenase [Thermodesulfobacteriota bacterium]